MLLGCKMVSWIYLIGDYMNQELLADVTANTARQELSAVQM